jgi:CubicO group peptidase (beta-lactamase class C family)
MHERVFEPLGMDSCTYQFPFPGAVAERIALPHDAHLQPAANDLHPSALAHGGLVCTPTDLAKLAVEVMRAHDGRRSTLLLQSTARTMLTSQCRPDEEVGGFNGQGLGAFLLSDGERTYFSHHGYNTPGTCCLLLANPSSGDGVVVMDNSSNGFKLIMEIIAGLADVYRWPEVRPHEEGPRPVP